VQPLSIIVSGWPVAMAPVCYTEHKGVTFVLCPNHVAVMSDAGLVISPSESDGPAMLIERKEGRND
jgi:hypothetical protein